MRPRFSIVLTAFLAHAAATDAAAADLKLRLDSATGLTLRHVQVEPVRFEGKRGLRVSLSAEAKQQIKDLPAGQQTKFETLAVVDGSDFASGVIEAEIAGVPAPDASPGARGFVGIAFRVSPDLQTYDAFYLRPTNGRADDQLRRNHAAQYVSHPDWPWHRLRDETPGRYESYVDIEPGKWIRIRIEVRGDRARLYVNGNAQPTLIVNDLKSGPQRRGAIALWIDSETIAHFRDLRVHSD